MRTKLRGICLVLCAFLIFPLWGCSSKDHSKEKIVSETKVSTTESKTPSTIPTQKKGSLAGAKIVIDAGHGCTVDYTEPIAPGLEPTNYEGPGTGTCGVSTKKPEKTLTLEIAKALKKELIKRGAAVVMIRSKKGTRLSLQERAEKANSSKADFSLRIHADGLDDPGVNGATLLYPSSQYVGENLSHKSRVIARYILDSYCSSTGLYNRGIVERGDLTGFNFSKIPVVLIELGFMTNPQEDKKMSQRDFQKKMVQGIAKGIERYYKSK